MNHLHTTFGIRLKKIRESDSKSPDLEMIVGDGRVFVLEIKDIEDVPVSTETGWTITECDFGITEAERKNNAVSRLAEKISGAMEQMKQFQEPKGIAFLNHDRRVRVDHLDELYRGYRVYSSGRFAYRNTAAQRISEGRFRKVKDTLDFFIWMDSTNGSITKCYFRYVSKAGRKILIQHFDAPFEC